MNRRNFFRRTVVAAAGLFAAPFALRASTPEPDAWASEERVYPAKIVRWVRDPWPIRFRYDGTMLVPFKVVDNISGKCVVPNRAYHDEAYSELNVGFDAKGQAYVVMFRFNPNGLQATDEWPVQTPFDVFNTKFSPA
jgi:hypothetical protein